jgi:hypothetical protein
MALSYEILKHANFRRLLATRLVRYLRDAGAGGVIVGWQVYTLTKDPLMLGLVGLTEALPAILFALFAGHIVDKSRPHRVFLNCLRSAQRVVARDARHCRWPDRNKRDHHTGHLIRGCVFIGHPAQLHYACVFNAAGAYCPPPSHPRGQCVALERFPASGDWRPPPSLASFMAVMACKWHGSSRFASWWGAVVAISGISEEYRSFKNHDSREPALKSIASGWRFVRSSNVLLPIMALDMFAVLFGGAVAMLPMFADQVLHTGSEGLGLLRAAPAVGSIITALYFCAQPDADHSRATTNAHHHRIWHLHDWLWSLDQLLLCGAFPCDQRCVRQCQHGDSQHLGAAAGARPYVRGRVSSLNSMFIISSNEIGAFESGLCSKFARASAFADFWGQHDLARRRQHCFFFALPCVSWWSIPRSIAD